MNKELIAAELESLKGKMARSKPRTSLISPRTIRKARRTNISTGMLRKPPTLTGCNKPVTSSQYAWSFPVTHLKKGKKSGLGSARQTGRSRARTSERLRAD